MTEKPFAVVVEDDVYLADIFSATLHSIGMEVNIFHDGESALQGMETMLPKLIILDLNLPKISGIDVLKALRSNARTAHTWVLVVTANPTQAAELKKMEEDDQSLLILAKPVSVDQMEQMARRLVL